MPGMTGIDDEMPGAAATGAAGATGATGTAKPKKKKAAKVKKTKVRAAAATSTSADAGTPVDTAPLTARASTPKPKKKLPGWAKWLIGLGTPILTLALAAVIWGGATNWEYIPSPQSDNGDPNQNQNQSAINASDFSEENLKAVEEKIKRIDDRVGTVTKFAGYEFEETDKDSLTGSLTVKFAGTDKDGKVVEYRITINGVTEPKSAAEIMDAITNADELILGIYGEQEKPSVAPETPSITERLEITEDQLKERELQNAIKGKNIGTVSSYISSSYAADPVAAQADDEEAVTSGVLTMYFGGTDGAGRDVVYKTEVGVTSDASTEDVLAQVRSEKPGSEVYTRTTSITQDTTQPVYFSGERNNTYSEFSTNLSNISISATAKYDPDRNETRCKSVKVIAEIDGQFVVNDFPAAEGLTFSGELSQEELEQAVLARYVQMYNASEGEAE